MLLSHPKQSKNVQNTPKFFVWVCCTDIMSVGPLPWDNNIFIKVLMSTVQRSPKSVQLKGPLGWIAKLRRRPWCIWIFDYNKLVQFPTSFYTAAANSYQYLLLKNLVTCVCMLNYHYMLRGILLHEKTLDQRLNLSCNHHLNWTL